MHCSLYTRPFVSLTSPQLPSSRMINYFKYVFVKQNPAGSLGHLTTFFRFRQMEPHKKGKVQRVLLRERPSPVLGDSHWRCYLVRYDFNTKVVRAVLVENERPDRPEDVDDELWSLWG